jgi:hypothetical protein
MTVQTYSWLSNHHCPFVDDLYANRYHVLLHSDEPYALVQLKDQAVEEMWVIYRHQTLKFRYF